MSSSSELSINSDHSFDFEVKPMAVNWLVQDFVPMGKLVFMIAQAGVGKSYLGEGLAVCVVYGDKFLDLKTEEGDVLLIDEDTPTDTLQHRIAKFGHHYGFEAPHKLFFKSMTGLSLRNQSLVDEINKHPSIKLCVIDCLTNVSGGLDMCKSSDMSVLGKLKNQCLRPDLTIFITHHITEKRELPVDILMTCDHHSLSMYSSVINQQADAFYVAGSPDTDGVLKQLCVRSISKRVSIKLGSFVCELKEDKDSLFFTNLKPYDIKESKLRSEIEEDILDLFRNKTKEMTVREIDVAMGGMYGVNTLREVLAIMRKKELLKLKKEAHNLFKYSLCHVKVW